MIAAAIIITLLYVFLMLFLLYGYFQVGDFYGKKVPPKSTFSVVIPLRNEAENLPHLFNSLLKLDYPTEKFEILLINDASEDASERLCEEFRQLHPQLNIQLLENIRKSGSPKKDAIQTAIKASQMEYILTTDADCILPEGWLREFDGLITTRRPDAVAGPVAYESKESKKSILNRFQELDLLSLQAATIGGFGVNIPFMCNGANFCYSKKAFLEVHGFEGNDHVGSGDDIFLLEKFQKRGLKITFLKSRAAIVSTNPAPHLSALFSQRIRWAAKTSAYRNTFGKLVGLVVFLMNLTLWTGAIAAVFKVFPSEVLALMFLMKFNVDFLLIFNSAKFFGRKNSLKSYFWSSIIYPFFSSTVAILSLFSGYEWKGRHFRK